jgi:hypothetical protein
MNGEARALSNEGALMLGFDVNELLADALAHGSR